MSKEFQALEAFTKLKVCQSATKPLRTGAEMSMKVGEAGPFRLIKEKEGLRAETGKPSKPDLSFAVTTKALEQLTKDSTDDVGEMGVLLLRLMASEDPEVKLHAKIHIGPLDLLLKGYLAVLPLGGPAVMKFLASKGFTNMGKIKEALKRMRTER